MQAIDTMMKEHENIERILKVARKLCLAILNGNAVDDTAFRMIIDFVRNYADRHHHSKEEEILFKKMSDELGGVVANGPIMGMFAEHDLGRLFMGNLELALDHVKQGDLDARVDVIANAIAYSDLLYRHIHKENTAIYTFAQKRLSQEAIAEVEKACAQVEDDATEQKIQAHYLDILHQLEERTK